VIVIVDASEQNQPQVSVPDDMKKTPFLPSEFFSPAPILTA